ncbi:HTH_Tnp_Tc3_2 domain-containing protein [Trichonephila clavipes]|nr:HTH_Tnp_Tc3_2 domain-containing protein [Trichonephila clavipes]
MKTSLEMCSSWIFYKYEHIFIRSAIDPAFIVIEVNACPHKVPPTDEFLKIRVREMGHSISQVAMKFRFSRTSISRVYREYRISGETSNLRHRCDRKKIMQERDQR